MRFPWAVPPAQAVPLALVASLGVLVAFTDYQVWSTVLIGTALILVGLGILRLVSAGETDARVRRLVALALVLKVAAGYGRYLVNAVLYDGGGDANSYAANGERLAQAWLQGDWIGSGRNVPGTGFIDGTTAALFALTGPSFVGGFLVYAWVGFWGLYLCYRAFCVAVPDGDRFRYAALVLLLPSLLFWPSAIGKDAWMILCIGLFSYGAARVFASRRGGLVLVAVGGLGTGLVRPHITLSLLLALTAGLLLRRRDASESGGGRAGRLAVLAVAVGGGLLALRQVEAFFDLSNDENVTDALEDTAQQTGAGGSSFEGSVATNPLALPYAIVTVLFRPFPFEATNLQSLMTSLEGAFLLGMFCLAAGRIAVRLKQLTSTPYVTYCLTYTLLFAAAFSSFNNFGILTRQRTQVLPLVLVLLALTFKVGRRTEGTPIPQDTQLRRRQSS